MKPFWAHLGIKSNDSWQLAASSNSLHYEQHWDKHPTDLISKQNTKSQAGLWGPVRAGKGFCANFAGRKWHLEYWWVNRTDEIGAIDQEQISSEA